MNLRSYGRRSAAVVLIACAACHDRSGSGTTTPVPAVGVYYAAPKVASVSEFAPAGAQGFLTVPGLGDDFEPQAGAAWVETWDGRASLVLELARYSDKDARIAVRLDLANALKPGAPHYAARSAPRKELDPGAYAELGGPVDTSTWRFYGLSGGEMRGAGALAGLALEIAPADVTGLQCGQGADNRGLGEGLSIPLVVTVVSQPLAGPPVAADGMLEIALALEDRERNYATGTTADTALGGVAHAALEAPALGGQFALQAEGSFHERADGTVQFEAMLVHTIDSSLRWQVTLRAGERRDVAAGDALPSGSPVRELPVSAYRPLGPVDDGEWRYYKDVEGTLIGLDRLTGAQALVSTGDHAMQVGRGAAGVDALLGATAALRAQIVAQPIYGAPLEWGVRDATLRLPLRRGWLAGARSPIVDATIATHSGAVLSVPGLATDLLALSGGEYSETTDGTAEVRTELASLDLPSQRWLLEMRLGGRVETPPAGSPVLALDAAAYAPIGTVLPDRWHYYTSASGRLRGQGPMAGAELAVAPGALAIQSGRGASNANASSGISGPLALTRTSQPTAGPGLAAAYGAELSLEMLRYADRCARTPVPDVSIGAPYGEWALSLPGIATDLMLADGAELKERGDGTATLSCVFQRAGDPMRRFRTDLRLSGRVEVGEKAPAGSPRLLLDPKAYADEGLAVDPERWHYYPTWEGTLTGLGPWQGAVLTIERAGSAMQVGRGANNKNLALGGSGSVLVHVVRQPGMGSVLAPTGTGELSFELLDSCR